MNRQSLKKLKLPDTSGVYSFIGGSKRGGRASTILYIGRATSLRSRVRSYFAPDITEKRGLAIAKMVEEAKVVEWEKTDSVLESLILEANLIKKFQPKYNVKEKDDKSFNYIVITKEDFPRVLLVRGRELLTTRYPPLATFGPFPRGSILRDAFKIIRKIFPFRDRCIPYSEHPFPYSNVLKNIRIGKLCFNAQIGLCPGVCNGAVEKSEYRTIIKNLSLFLGGKKKLLVRKLEREMKSAAKKKEFEHAGELKRTIFALQHIQDVALIKDRPLYQRRFLIENMRIEAYDIAHISGTAMVGAMAVVVDGEPEKSEYRKFKIKTVRGADDTASLEEVLRRRFGHPEWQYPRLVVVDGGVTQKNRAEYVLKEMEIKIPIVSVVKDERHRPRNILGLKRISQIGETQMYAGERTQMRADEKRALESEILLANSEAHRFAISYHKKIRDRIR